MADKDLPSWISWLAGWAEPGPRPWRGALWRGLAAVYAVQPVAFLTSPLGECDHCIAQFWRLFVALPGLVVGLLVNGRAGTMGFKLVTGAVLVAVLVASIGAARRGGRFGALAALVIALLSALNATMVGHLIRM
jgi:hypothetical protein